MPLLHAYHSRDRGHLPLAAGGSLVALATAAGVGFAFGTWRMRRRMAPPCTVLVTGGSRGLGLALAETYLDRGARVAICARDAAELERAKDELDGRGRPVVALPCDVTRRDEVEEMVATARQRIGPIEALVNNAGIVTVGPAEHMTVEDYEAALQVHFFGPLYTTLAVLPQMRARGGGRIVNISSVGGRVPVPHLLPYVVSKFALTGFSEGLRAELAKENIRVTTVCPGLMRTGSPRQATVKGRHRKEYAWFSVADSLPLLSASAARAARRIVRASEQGRAHVIVTLPAQLASAFHGLLPGATANLMALADRYLLPAAGGVGQRGVSGRDSTSDWSPSRLTQLGDRAAARYNQHDPSRSGA